MTPMISLAVCKGGIPIMTVWGQSFYWPQLETWKLIQGLLCRKKFEKSCPIGSIYKCFYLRFTQLSPKISTYFYLNWVGKNEKYVLFGWMLCKSWVMWTVSQLAKMSGDPIERQAPRRRREEAHGKSRRSEDEDTGAAARLPPATQIGPACWSRGHWSCYLSATS